MDLHESHQPSLTNEKVKQRFKSQFELVNHAIKLADHMIKTGRSSRVDIDNQNPAVVIIQEIEEGADVYEDISYEEKVVQPKIVEEPQSTPPKSQEKKKARRILAV